MSNNKIARLTLYQHNRPVRRLAVRSNLKAPITVGREGYGAVIDLDNPYVSRIHASITIVGGSKLVLKDMESTGGTQVNDKRITTHILEDGEVITFGESQSGYKLQVELIEQEEELETPFFPEEEEEDPDKNKGKGIDVDFSDAGLEESNPNQDANKATEVVSQTTIEGLLSDGGRNLGSTTSDLSSLLNTKSEIVIGRAEDADIVLPQMMVTRQHAKVNKTNQGDYLLTDMGSTNGTFVNGRPIVKPTRITDTDDIKIGHYKFTLKKPAEDMRQQKEVALWADGLTRTVNNGRTAILREVSFKLPSQELVAIMGPSGSGKSTLLKALNGDAPATSGKVYVYGMELYSNYNYLKHLIGYVPQDDIVHKELTVERSLYYAAKLRLSSDVSGKDIRKKITEVLTSLNINDTEIRKRKIVDLSGGQRKRVSIAVELLTDPSVLFLDEPTSPLDPETIEDFLLCLKKLAKKGTTILMVTHKPDDLHYADKLIFLSKGGLMTYYGSPRKYLQFFEASNVIEVYARNATLEKGLEWSSKFNDSRAQSAMVHQPNEALNTARKESFFKQLFWLTIRYFNIKLSDMSNTAILLLQAPIIAGLLALIYEELELGVMFFMTISAIWFGTNNAAKEIVEEIPVYKRERMYNLRIMPYILSKVLVLTFFSALQATVFVYIIYKLIGTEALTLNTYWENVGIMLLLCVSSTFLGLWISAMAKNTQQVMTLVPIVLIPQIILAGVIATIPAKSVVEYASYAMFSRWGTESFAFVQDSLRRPFIPSPEAPDSLAYNTVDAVDLLNLPNTIGLPHELSTNLYILGILNVFIFIGMYWALQRKDSLK